MKNNTSPQEKQARTTRRRGRVQERFVHARSVWGHLLCLDQDAFATVLVIEGISYDLKSPEEQRRLNEQFQHLLAGLGYPVQILWRVLPLNLNDYLQQFTCPEMQEEEDRDGEQPPTIWPLVSQSHAEFLKALSTRRTLLKRSIYLVLRVHHAGSDQESHLQRFMRSRRRRRQRRAHMTEQARQELDLRAGEMMRHLLDMNLSVRRLRGPHELVPFYYSCLTPTKADRFPLPAAVIEALDRPIQATPLPERDPVEGVEARGPTIHTIHTIHTRTLWHPRSLLLSRKKRRST